MDGKTLNLELFEVLGETPTSNWMSAKWTYDLLYRAAIATNNRAQLITSSQTVTTVAETSAYNLNGDFSSLYLTDDQNRHYIKYYDTSAYTYIYEDSYDSIYLANNTTSQSIPNCFTIKDATQITNYTGTATSDGSATNQESTLTDTAATFTNVYAGDYVHNTTDDSHGIVVSKTSNTVLVVALFGGTDNEWDSSDAYVIVPQMRYSLVVDPLSKTAAHSIYVPYVMKPTPVYSYYRAYNFPSGFTHALVCYAAWLYRYKDREPNFGDGLYRIWDMGVKELGQHNARARNRRGYRVNFIKPTGGSWSFK